VATDTPDFSPLAERYAASRPTYPAELYDWLATECARHALAWDCGTGSGQAARDLAARFERVVGTDPSSEQLRFAPRHPRIEWRVAPAEASGLEAASADLITAAAAVHWFDLAAFGAEVLRVAARPSSLLAVWTYHAGIAEPPVDRLLHHLYWDILQPYFASGARLVDARYATLVLPGSPIAAPSFTMKAAWRKEQFVGYLESWSGFAAYRRQHGDALFDAARQEVDRIWAGRSTIDLRWPLFVRAQRIPGSP
jgi:SAM-dependent methyltransferase